jgi:hypothetical protein
LVIAINNEKEKLMKHSMKHLAIGISALMLSVQARSEEERSEQISKTTSPLEVALNKDTVRCFGGAHELLYLEVLIPALADITTLEHRHTADGIPYVAAGDCENNQPYDIINPERPTESIEVTVTLTSLLLLDNELETCSERLHEEVTTRIRGIDFSNVRTDDPQQLPYEHCL